MSEISQYYGFIYKWTNSITGQYYIGQHKGHIEDGYTGSGVSFRENYHACPEDWDREIISYCQSLEELNKLESELVTAETLSDELCLNLAYGGGGGTTPRIPRYLNKSFYWMHIEHQGFIGTIDELVYQYPALRRNSLVDILEDVNRSHDDWISLEHYDGDLWGIGRNGFSFMDGYLFEWKHEEFGTFVGSCREFAEKFNKQTGNVGRYVKHKKRKGKEYGGWVCTRIQL